MEAELFSAAFPLEKEERVAFDNNNFEQQNNFQRKLQEISPSREFEEEIANLLVDFKNQDAFTVAQRMSPSVSKRFENNSYSSQDTKELLHSPTQKRRRTELLRTDIEKDVSSSENEEKNQHKQPSQDANEDSDFEYDDDFDFHTQERDEEYLEDEDDDWFAGLKPFSAVSPDSPSGRLVRKKAPSGSACEKHKRWKKRCPDDCPMRTSKQPRRRKPTPPSSNTVSPKMSSELIQPTTPEIVSPPRTDHGHELFQVENSKLSEVENQEIIKNLFSFVVRAKEQSQPTRSDFLSLIRWSLSQLAAEGFSYSTDEWNAIETALLVKIEQEANADASRARRTRQIKEESSSSRNLSTTMACERHTALHARCPPNCPERRPTETLGRGKKRSKLDDSEIEWNEVGSDDCVSDSTTSSSSSSYGRLLKKESPKVKSTKSNSKGRTGRKYLPQACDRHKLLHAKCPANCPDRIKRDSEVAKSSRFSPSSPIMETTTNSP